MKKFKCVQKKSLQSLKTTLLKSIEWCGMSLQRWRLFILSFPVWATLHEMWSPFLHPNECGSGPGLLWPMECGRNSILWLLSANVKRAAWLLLFCSWSPEPPCKKSKLPCWKEKTTQEALKDEEALEREDLWRNSEVPSWDGLVLHRLKYPTWSPDHVEQMLIMSAVSCPDP
jgi:hypothetical protein